LPGFGKHPLVQKTFSPFTYTGIIKKWTPAADSKFITHKKRIGEIAYPFSFSLFKMGSLIFQCDYGSSQTSTTGFNLCINVLPSHLTWYIL